MTPSFDDVQAAAQRLKGRIRRTPMLRHRALDAAAGGVVLVKPEPLQITGSFKLRGATNAAMLLPPEARARGVVTHSSGNHGQAVAAACAALGMPALIAMPQDAPSVKVEATRAWGAEIHFFDRHGVDRDALAQELAAQRGATVIPPFDHADVIAGQGTAILELLEDARAEGFKPDQIAICTGGGGLLAGSALSAKALAPQARIYAVEPEGWDDYGRSLRAGQRIANDGTGAGLCDALLSKQPGQLTFAVNAPRVADGLVVTPEEVFAAMRFAFTHLKLVVEPGGAVALAAVLAGKLATRDAVTGIILSGGNVDRGVFAQAMAA
ncbi:threonine/serine dehydratase [Roseococcus sp. SDR]|uniref:threonine ammonia-lyase n=1 Tax=Roseococcus sp. SDR TaxID=2835532 RepID=UPI001BCDC031|nr:threonine/serine dehydratase [Roseococcus sp. SDR]MBS7790236.1 threonine/serine dehydratase [Roseococcus sp. SDR]MBV1845550.1 threonine/serine dehydratase [Roseococcus sp. SDR]